MHVRHAPLDTRRYLALLHHEHGGVLEQIRASVPDDVYQRHVAGIGLLLRTLGTKARLREGLGRLQPGSLSGKLCEGVCPGA